MIIVDDELNLKKPDTKIITNPDIKVFYFNSFLQKNYQIIEKDLERFFNKLVHVSCTLIQLVIEELTSNLNKA